MSQPRFARDRRARVPVTPTQKKASLARNAQKLAWPRFHVPGRAACFSILTGPLLRNVQAVSSAFQDARKPHPWFGHGFRLLAGGNEQGSFKHESGRGVCVYRKPVFITDCSALYGLFDDGKVPAIFESRGGSE